jgi:hypothetical protein
MNQKTKKRISEMISKKKFLTMALFLGMSSIAFAGPIGTATSKLAEYRSEMTGLVYAVGGIVGFIGGLRIYNKWQNGDQDVNKEMLGYGGAMIFLFMVPTIVGAFF